jgi:predicted lipid-binding transport protein (Tim44 family)
MFLMNRLFLSLFLGLLSLSFVAAPADAKRLGGGSTAGMKRQAPPPAQPTTPAQQQAAPGQQAARQPAVPAANAAAAAPKRSWLGPVAGLAAGLGIAALASHLGFGEGLANFMTLALLAVLAVVVLRFVMRRFAGGGARLAGAGAGASAAGPAGGSATPAWRVAQPAGEPSAAWSPAPSGASAAVATAATPAGFDAPAFERIAKLIFIRMQAANDAGNLDDLRQFSTPEMFATFRLDLQERGGAKQQTDVVQLDAQVLEAVQEGDQQIVSVRFSGLIREVIDGPAEPFDEVWHLAKPADGSREWAIAGIAQTA